MTKKEATFKAHQMYAYEMSEQADLKTDNFDDLWQSIYDVCHLTHGGVLDLMDEDEFEEATLWLKETQSLTKNYQDYEINF